MTFVRTDASREITLVSPLAASGRRGDGEASDAGGKRRPPWRRDGRCLQSRHVALVVGLSTTVNRRLLCREQQRQRQQHRPHLLAFVLVWYTRVRSSSDLQYVLHRHVFVLLSHSSSNSSASWSLSRHFLWRYFCDVAVLCFTVQIRKKQVDSSIVKSKFNTGTILHCASYY